MTLDDPQSVREQYASEDNLRARQSLYADAAGVDAKDVLWRTLLEWEPRRVLEVGGGPGELSERLGNQLGANVSFVDISPRMVELAAARGIEAQVGDVQALPFADGSFDTAVAAWMLYHVPDLDRALSELARVLIPGGGLIAVTNSVSHLRELRDLVEYPAGFEESFSRENGEEYLARHFATVDRFDAEQTVTIRDRQKLVDYQKSMQIPTRPVPDDVELPFVTHARVSIFLATT